MDKFRYVMGTNEVVFLTIDRAEENTQCNLTEDQKKVTDAVLSADIKKLTEFINKQQKKNIPFDYNIIVPVRTNNCEKSRLKYPYQFMCQPTYHVPLLYAALAMGRVGNNAVKLLCENGADIRMLGEKKETFFHLSAQGTLLLTIPEVVKWHKILGVDVAPQIDALDEKGHTPLMISLINGKFDDFFALIEAGANPKVGTTKGRTIAHFVVEEIEDVNAIQYLADAGISLEDKDEDGRTAYLSAVANKRLDIINLSRLRKLVDVEATDNNGDTDLHIAARGGNLRILNALGIFNMEKKNKQGFTPLQVALEAENVAAVKFLILKGAKTKVLNEQTNTEIDLTKQIEALYDKKKDEKVGLTYCEQPRYVKYFDEKGRCIDTKTYTEMDFVPTKSLSEGDSSKEKSGKDKKKRIALPQTRGIEF